MEWDVVSWALGYVITRAANRVLKQDPTPTLSRTLGKTVAEWSRRLPKGCAVEPQALFGQILADVDSDSFPALQSLRSRLRNSLVPTVEMWTAALLEQWASKHLQLGEDGQAFFQLHPDLARKHLSELGSALFRACNADIATFNNTVAAQLEELLRAQPSTTDSNLKEGSKPDIAAVQAALAALSLEELQRRIVEPWVAASGYESVADVTPTDSAIRVLVAAKEELCDTHVRILFLSKAEARDLLSENALADITSRVRELCSQERVGGPLVVREILLITPFTPVARGEWSSELQTAEGGIPLRLVDGIALARDVLKRAPRAVVSLNDRLRHRIQAIAEQDELSELSQYGNVPKLSEIFVEVDHQVFGLLEEFLRNALDRAEATKDIDYKEKAMPLSKTELECVIGCWTSVRPSALVRRPNSCPRGGSPLIASGNSPN